MWSISRPLHGCSAREGVLIGEANPSRTMRCFMALPGALEVSTATSHQAFDVCQERVDPKPSGSSELLIVSRSILEAVDL